jgi:hypothetical protein
MKHLLFILCVLAGVLVSCKKNDSSSAPSSPAADSYVGNWTLYDTVQNTQATYQRNFTIQKLTDSKVLILDLPYAHDSIYLVVAPSFIIEYSNLKFPIDEFDMYYITASHFNFTYDIYRSSDVDYHFGYAVKN